VVKLLLATAENSQNNTVKNIRNSRLKIVLRILFATALIFIGVLGVLLPVLQGIPFLLAGLIILSLDFPYIEERLEKFVLRHKSLEKLYRKVHKIIKKYIF
jgi:uncharacterized membrane protein YbaN (DUF454 family)